MNAFNGYNSNRIQLYNQPLNSLPMWFTLECKQAGFWFQNLWSIQGQSRKHGNTCVRQGNRVKNLTLDKTMLYAVIQPPTITLSCSVPVFFKLYILTKSLWRNRSSKKCTGFKLHRPLEHDGLQFSICWWSTIFNLWTTKDFSSALQRLAKI